LRIVDIAFPAWHRTSFPGIGKNDLQATRLKHFIGGDPIDPSRFHDHGLEFRSPPSQFAMRCKSLVNAWKVWTGSSHKSGLTATTWNRAPMSMPAMQKDE
jgi:hypothetical protein